MNYSRKLIFAVLLAATSVIAADHDNNIIYKDGETLKIQSKIGVDVQLIGENTEFSVTDKDGSTKVFSIDKKSAGLDRITVDGASASNLVEDIVKAYQDPTLAARMTAAENNIERIDGELEELRPLKQFAVDYSIFKSVADTRFNSIYNDLGHTMISNDGIDTNKSTICFPWPTRNMIISDVYGGLMGLVDGTVWRLTPGQNPADTNNWKKTLEAVSVEARTAYDNQPVFAKKYARDFAFNKYENRFYILHNGGGISYCKDGDLSKWYPTTFADGIIKKVNGKTVAQDEVNTYHAAVGVDGTMIATTEFGPVYKLKGETVWKAIELPGHADNKAVRCIVAGNTFLRKAEAAEIIRRENAQIEVRQTRDLGMSRDANETTISDYLLPSATRFVLGSTDDEGVWYSDPFNVTNGWTHVTTLADGSTFATGFRQIVFHNGTYVAPVHKMEGQHAANRPKGIFYSYDGVTWKLSPGTQNFNTNMYEPTFALGTFVAPFTWGTKIDGQSVAGVISANPEQGFKYIRNGCGYGIVESEFGFFMYGDNGVYNVKNGARLVSPVIYSKTEVDAMINELKRKIDALVPAGSLQPLE